MKPEIFSAENVIVQGITGAHGQFHTKAMLAAGTNVVAGTSPNKAGQSVDGVPVFDSIATIKQQMTADISVIFVPARFVKAAIFEAIENEIPLIVCITEGIPVHDMIQVRARLAGSRSVLIGPNCPGVLLPDVNKLGIIPAKLGLSGSTAIVSRSGTLTYEAVAGLTEKGVGQKYVIGIGGDRVRGSSFEECLQMFEDDSDVTQIVMIGEIGGTDELRAADFIKQSISKPVFGYIAGHHAPTGVQLGHAGAILGSDQESASAKTKALEESGVAMFSNIVDVIDAAAGGI